MEDAITALVFDMDGVLLDSESVYERCWNRVAERLGLDGIADVHRQALGLGEADTVRLLEQRYGPGFDGAAFWQQTSALAEEIEAAEGIPSKPYAREALAGLKERGYALALASSTARPVAERQLAHAGLLGLFDRTVCGDEVPHAKPAPDIYAAACARLGFPPPRCAAVEDSPNGIRSAHAAGLRCILIPDRIPPDADTKAFLWKLLPDLRSLAGLFGT